VINVPKKTQVVKLGTVPILKPGFLSNKNKSNVVLQAANINNKILKQNKKRPVVLNQSSSSSSTSAVQTAVVIAGAQAVDMYQS
jgi:hypothetical protein